MQRFLLSSVLLSFAILASPGQAAQQTDPQQDTSPAPQYVPPPLPPMPYSHHRTTGGSGHVVAHRSTISSHRATSSRHHETKPVHHPVEERRTTHKSHRTHDRHATHEPDRTAKASKRTIRKCHGMTYSQIMHSSSCRALMKQELDSADHRQTHASKKHKTAHHRAVTKRHGTKRHHRD